VRVFEFITRSVTALGNRYRRRSRRRFLRSPAYRLRRVSARYDAAQTTDENRRHWAGADLLSADAAANPQVRSILRARARYEVANNSYAKGIVLTLANDTVGTGPRLQMLTDDAKANALVEREFTHWAECVGLTEKLRTMRMARATDGEAFALLVANPKLDVPVKLDVRLIEADQVASPYVGRRPEAGGRRKTTNGASSLTDGILFDRYGNPVEYYILRNHPGDTHGFGSLEYDRVAAEFVIHDFRADRPGQHRGVPEITPALPLFAQLRRYTLAVIAAAETAADFAGILYTDAPPGGEADAAEPFEPIELEQRALLTMPGGWKMSQLEAEQPSTTYAEFKREILNEISRCLNMPFNVAAGNSSGYNYASGRLDHQTYYKAIRVDQEHMARVVLDRILRAWLDEAILVSDYLPLWLRTVPLVQLPHQWFWDGQEHVDPAKEASAQATRLQSHTTTLAYEYARQGRDWETELRQRAKEVALMRTLGLTPSQAQPQPVAHEETEEEEAVDAQD